MINTFAGRGGSGRGLDLGEDALWSTHMVLDNGTILKFNGDFSNKDFEGFNLRKFLYSRLSSEEINKVQKIDFSGCVFNDSYMDDVNFNSKECFTEQDINVDFTGASFENTCFHWLYVNNEYSDFSNCNLTNTNFSANKYDWASSAEMLLYGTKFEGAKLDDAIFTGRHICGGASFKNASGKFAVFKNISLGEYWDYKSVSFENAILPFSTFSFSYVRQDLINFSKADIAYSIFLSPDFLDITRQKLITDGANITGCIFPQK